MAVKPTRDDRAVRNNASTWADAAHSEIEEVILQEAGADPLCGNNNEANEKSRRKHDAANSEAIDQAANKRADRGLAQIVDSKRERDRTATSVKILRDGFEEDAEGIDSDGRFAEKKAHSGDGDDPPAVEEARMS